MAKEKDTLTDRERKFVELVHETSNKTQSYKDAGYKAKNDNTAAVSASRMLKKPKIIKYLNSLREKTTTSHVMSTIERKEWLSSVIKGIKVDNYGKPIWMESRLRAMDILNKMDGEYTDNVNLVGDMEINVKVDYGDGDNSTE